MKNKNIIGFMIATKEEKYDNEYKKLVVGSIAEYETTRCVGLKEFCEKKVDNAAVMLRVQGAGNIRITGIFISMEKTGKTIKNRSGDKVNVYVIKFKISKFKKINTEDFYDKFKIKAGAEYGYLKNKKI